MKIVRAGDPNFTKFMFTWMLTNWCNYQCTYCCEKTNMTDKWLKDDSISSYKLTLAKLKNFDAPFHMELYGGEPTLHPNLKEIMLTINAAPNCTSMQVTTNLSRPLHYFEDLNVPELNGVIIAASFHPEYYSHEFLDKVLAINQMEHLQIRLTVVLSDKKDYWPMTLEFIDSLVQNKVEHGVHFLTETPLWKPVYTSEFYETFRAVKDTLYKGQVVQLHQYEYDNGELHEYTDLEIYEHNLHYFNGYQCTSRFFEIDFDGTFRNTCTRREFKGLSVSKEKLERRESCPRDCCGCEMMFNAYKELN